MFMPGGYLRWWQLYQHVHIRWISAVMTVIPTCWCQWNGYLRCWQLYWR
jgi:hypothetical protein